MGKGCCKEGDSDQFPDSEGSGNARNTGPLAFLVHWYLPKCGKG
jgi:hypothetical protein